MKMKVLLPIMGIAVLLVSIVVYVVVTPGKEEQTRQEADRAATSGTFEKVREPEIPNFSGAKR